MHRFITLACAVTAAAFWVVGCGSSDDSSSSSGGSGGSSSDAACVASDYAGLTQSTFAAGVTAGGKCAGSTDASSVCANDVSAKAEQCGTTCFGMFPTDDTGDDACVGTCLNGQVTPVLSTDCVSCYVTDVACARTHCLLSCGSQPASQDCATCRQTNHCVDAFYSCSGLPVPGATSGSGGSSSVGAGGDSSASAGVGG